MIIFQNVHQRIFFIYMIYPGYGKEKKKIDIDDHSFYF